MKKYMIAGIVGCLLIAIVLGVVAVNNADKGIPRIVVSRYTDYLDETKDGITINTLWEYCHFEIPEMRDMAVLSGGYLLSYEILEWESLSDKLWAVTTEFKTNQNPEGEIGVNFVGLIDGKYLVMNNVINIPEELKANIDLSKFQNSKDSAVSYQNLVKPAS